MKLVQDLEVTINDIEDQKIQKGDPFLNPSESIDKSITRIHSLNTSLMSQSQEISQIHKKAKNEKSIP